MIFNAFGAGAGSLLYGRLAVDYGKKAKDAGRAPLAPRRRAALTPRP